MEYLIELPDNLTYETIYGQIVSKANSYQAVPDKQGGKRIIKNTQIRKYEKSFIKQCSIYKNKQINKQPNKQATTTEEIKNKYIMGRGIRRDSC